MTLRGDKDSWDIYMDALRLDAKMQGYTCASDVEDAPEVLHLKEERDSFLLLPMAKIEQLKVYRKKKGYELPAFFLVLRQKDIPKAKNLKSHLQGSPVHQLLCSPHFGEIKQALYRGEAIIYVGAGSQNEDTEDGGHLPEEREPKNVFAISADEFSINYILKRIRGILDNIKEIKAVTAKVRAKFYETFINIYDFPLDSRSKPDIEIKQIFESGLKYPDLGITDKAVSSELAGLEVKDLLGCAEEIYRLINGQKKQAGSGHWESLDLFRGPIPFYLDEYLFKLVELKKILKDQVVNLLLIDNKAYKYYDKDDQKKEGPLYKLLLGHLRHDFGLEGITFDLKMLKKKFPEEWGNDDQEECFQYERFIKKEEEKDYKKTLLNEMKENQFILLDFFLDADNYYLAHDFIAAASDWYAKDRHVSARHYTWYFITSEVHDSVMKYAKSGLLSDHYESAVVNGGDDPVHKQRQFIYVYKLVCFIHSRLNKFHQQKISFESSLLGRSAKECAKCLDAEGTEIAKNCLEKNREKLKYLLMEFDNLKPFFYSEKSDSNSEIPQRKKQILDKIKKELQNSEKLSEEDLQDLESGLYVEKTGSIAEIYDREKRILEKIEETLYNFEILPEADWQVIQYSIDYINAQLKETKDHERQFSCNYIAEEIKERSRIY